MSTTTTEKDEKPERLDMSDGLQIAQPETYPEAVNRYSANGDTKLPQINDDDDGGRPRPPRTRSSRLRGSHDILSYRTAMDDDQDQAPHIQVPPDMWKKFFAHRRRKYWFTIAMSFTIVAALVGTSIGGGLVVQEKADKKAEALAAEQAAASSSMELFPTPTSASPSDISADAPSETPTDSPAAATEDTGTYYSARPFGAIQSINTTCPSTLLISSRLEGKKSDISGRYTYNCLDSTNILDTILMSFTAYTLEQCVDACSQYSAMNASSACKAAVISSDFSTRYETENGANCWLKSGSGDASTGQNGYTAAVLRED
ncbi:uncharacterized protein J4E87_009458 [Alternaria ethzedia]|uniref:uncharacterized protein n=1 Tax=Alternaria ethzedia TaxID=181014 RepID=UPI0020C51AAB|nr:uncharacterized protein J4E87_009458 [Alternaria ethzedia]KAI4614657.1 hypothetical protein J4E87_009458 [Alternaria ethzedia]